MGSRCSSGSGGGNAGVAERSGIRGAEWGGRAGQESEKRRPAASVVHSSGPGQRWGKQGNRARVLFPIQETARRCFRRNCVLDWVLEGTADHPRCTLSWELGGVLRAPGQNGH